MVSGTNPNTRFSKLAIHAAFLLIILLAAGLRSYELNTRPFWGDEALTGDLALLGPASVLRTTAPFSFVRQIAASAGGQFVTGWGFQMPLPLLASLTGLIGNQDMLIRLPSFLAGVLAVAVAFALGRRLRRPEVGLLLAFLMAISAFHIQYSQEARYYGLMSFLAVLGAYLMLRGLDEKRAGDLIAFVFVSAFNVWNHLFAVFFVVPMVVYAVVILGIHLVRSVRLPRLSSLRRRTNSRRKTMRSRLLGWQQVTARALRRIPLAYAVFVVSVVVLALLTLEITLPVVRAATSSSASSSEVATIFSQADSARTTEGATLHGFSLSVASFIDLFAEFGSGRSWASWLYLAFALFGLTDLLLRRQWRQTFFVLLWLWLPLLLVSLVRSEHFFASKYIIFVQPAYLALVALGLYAGVSRLWALPRAVVLRVPVLQTPLPAAILVGALTVLLLLVNTRPVLGYYGQQDRLNWRGVIRYIQADLRTDDAVLFATARDRDWGPFVYYFRQMVKPQAFGSFVQSFADLSAPQLQSVFDNHKRVWIVDQAGHGGFREVGTLFPALKARDVVGAQVYLLDTAPVLNSQVPFEWAAGRAQLTTKRAALPNRSLIVGVTPYDASTSQRFSVHVNGQNQGSFDPAGVQAPNYVQVPFTRTEVVTVDIIAAQPPTTALSGTLTLAYAAAIPGQDGQRVTIEAEDFPTDNGFVFEQPEASGGSFVRAQGFGIIAQVSLWASQPGDYLLTLYGRMNARIGTPKWSVVLDRQAVGILTTPVNLGWQTISIPVNVSSPGLHTLTLGATADAYIEGAYADLDYVTLEERQNWVYRGSTQISLGVSELTETAPITATGALTACVTTTGAAGRWLDSQPVTFTVTVENAADYVLELVTASTNITQPLPVTLDDRFLGQIAPGAHLSQTTHLLSRLSTGEHEILLTPPATVQPGQLCLQEISLLLAYVQPDSTDLRIEANPFVVGENARLQRMSNRPVAMGAGAGAVIEAGLWFSSTGNYTLNVDGLHDRPGPVQLRAELDGKPLERTLDYARNDYTWSLRSVRMPVGAVGYHRLRLVFANDLYDTALVANKDDGDRNAVIDFLTVSNLAAPVVAVGNQTTFVMAEATEMMPPGTAVEEAGGVRAIMRPAAGPVVSMDLAFDTAGGYQLSVRAQNDQPGPVDLAVMLDGAQIGVLSYAANDGSWSEQSLLFSVGLPGFHRLALEFVTDAYDQELVDAGQDGDRNALVETVSLTKIPAAINRGDVLIDLNFDDLLSSGAADQPRLDRIEGTFAFVFGPGNEIAFPLVFLGDGNYVLEVGGRGARLGNNLALEMDGSLLEDLSFDLQTESHFVGIMHKAGTVMLRLRNTSSRDLYVQTLRIYGNVLYADPNLAWTPDQGGLAEGTQLIQEGGHEAAMRAGTGPIVTLNVLLPKPGVYRLSVLGQNDRPGPVIVDVQLSNIQRGQIFFNADDGSWETRTLQIVSNRAGMQLLTLIFNNDVYWQDVIDKGGDGDRNALIERIQIAPLSSDR
ncbi:MAG: glycosyltransferase family 39 protein [Anaerolineae bacterium]